MVDALKATCGALLCGALLLGCSDNGQAGAGCEEREGTRVVGPECAQFIGFGFFCTCTCEFCVDGDGNAVE